jgi:hypothetical protein
MRNEEWGDKRGLEERGMSHALYERGLDERSEPSGMLYTREREPNERERERG